MLRYDGKFYRSLALPFGWGRRFFWFVNMLKPFLRYRREVVRVLILSYIDDFLLAPSVRRATYEANFNRVPKEVDALLLALGLEIHETKGVWEKYPHVWNIWGGLGYRKDGFHGNGGEGGESTSACPCTVERGEVGTEMGFEE